jgi:hypothetical protein
MLRGAVNITNKRKSRARAMSVVTKATGEWPTRLNLQHRMPDFYA